MKPILKLFSLIILLLLMSCSIQKRHYMPGFYIENGKKHDNLQKIAAQSSPQLQLPKIELRKINNFSNRLPELTASLKPVVLPLCSKKIEDCDLVILKTGDEIKAKVTEITLTEIRYKRCDNLSGPTISIAKKDVFMIKYSNGTKDIITVDKEENKVSNSASVGDADKKMNGLAVASFILALVSFVGAVYFTLGLITAILAIIMGAIALVQIKRNKNKYKGRGLALTGLIIGIISFLAWSLLIGLVAAYV